MLIKALHAPIPIAYIMITSESHAVALPVGHPNISSLCTFLPRLFKMSRTFLPDTSGPSVPHHALFSTINTTVLGQIIKLTLRPLTIHYTLKKGAEAYYSGVRVVVLAKKIGNNDDFAKVEIQARRAVVIEIEPSEGKDEAFNDHAPSNDGLPLCTLIFELVDISNATDRSAAEIRFTDTKTSMTEPVQVPDTHRVLYDHTKHTTVQSPSCILFLATKYAELQRRLKQTNRFGLEYAIPARIHLPTHGFRILPPSERPPFFIQPPPEILYHIFSILAYNKYHIWRGGLVPMSLVCRAWKVVVYEDLGSQFLGKPLIRQLATILEKRPRSGRWFQRFSPLCFTSADIDAQCWRDALTIFKTTSNMKTLLLGHVGAVLAGKSIEAFCKMTQLQKFTQWFPMDSLGVDDEDSKGQTHLNAAQLTKCFAHWPKLQQAKVYKFGQPCAEDGTEFAPARCALDQIIFEHGLVSMTQLRAMTASSQDTLHVVVLRYIRGISNEELTFWLFDFGLNLTELTLEFNVFTRSEADELAVDATMLMMPKLSLLEVDGPVVTALTLLRFGSDSKGRIAIRDAVLFDLHAFVIALCTTVWQIVSVTGLRILNENLELVEEAKKVAKERGIDLSVLTQ